MVMRENANKTRTKNHGILIKCYDSPLFFPYSVLYLVCGYWRDVVELPITVYCDE